MRQQDIKELLTAFSYGDDEAVPSMSSGPTGSEWKFQALSDLVSEVVVSLDEKGRVRGWNGAAAALFGYESREAAGQDFFRLVAAPRQGLEQLEVDGPADGEKRATRRVGLVAKRRTGEEFPVEIALVDAPPGSGWGSLIVARSPSADGFAAALLQKSRQRLEEALARQEETERFFAQRQQRDERLIWQLMHHDPLSGLPNRLLMMERTAAAMQEAEAQGHCVGMLVVGIHHFTYINDVLGHLVGDFIMTTVAAKLNGCLDGTETLARLDSVEFAVLLPSIASAREAEDVADRLIAAAGEPISVEGHELVVFPCIGIAVFPGDGTSPETLVRNASAAMYEAKREGNAGRVRYTASSDKTALERLSMEEDLRRALDRGELEVFYQPQVNVRKGIVDAAEALIRWRRPGHGLVSPAQFIPLAEENGMIIPIGAWVLEQACKQLKAWHDGGARNLRMAVNLSARQFHQSDLDQRVGEVLARTGVPPECLELEITESALMGNTQRGAAMLQQFKNMGVRIALDDFGTGYSSLNYLKGFPVDTLKIDQSFVKRIPQDESDCAIVCAIIALARSLRLDLVAEGVETPQQLGFMRQHGCNVVQGYLFSPPVQAAEFEPHLGAKARKRAALVAPATLPR